jgi:hypothetical protein
MNVDPIEAARLQTFVPSIPKCPHGVYNSRHQGEPAAYCTLCNGELDKDRMFASLPNHTPDTPNLRHEPRTLRVDEFVALNHSSYQGNRVCLRIVGRME